MARQSNWMAALRAYADRTSISETARRLNRSKTMVSLILADKYRHCTRQFAARVRARLMTTTREPQLRAIDPKLHRELRALVDTHGANRVGTWCSTEPAELIRFLRGTSKSDAREFARRVKRLAVPDAVPCSSCGGVRLCNTLEKSCA